MRTRLLSLTMLLISLFPMAGRAQDADMHYVYFSDGRVWGYPKAFVKDVQNNGGECFLVLEDDSIVSWSAAEVETVSETAPAYPQFTVFELDDKRNDQLYRDVEATVTADEVTASVSGIGKYLTPSFSMDMPDAVAYVNGKEQASGESRLRFADVVTYTLGRPDYMRLSVEKVSDEVWGKPETGMQEVVLTEDMLSTNAPTSFADEGLGMMLDGDPNTIFHSTWSQDPVYDVDLSKQVYLAVALPYAISDLKFYYTGRSQAGYNIEEWQIEASNDGEDWTYITTLDESMGVPVDGSSVSYTSDAIALGASYKYVRFVAVRSQYKNYLCLSEFRLYEVTGDEGEPELLQPAEYAYRMVPMGREVPVRIDWLTDRAASVPRIDIDIDGGEMVSSKEYYLNALITFRGNGVWDDYDFQDSVKIKGRGNSSWSTPSSYYDPKNPYRLKFSESVKPFGMKKGKNWNLIAQAQSGSLMTNPVAHKIARMVGVQTANDVVPVEFYMNGEYRGSYFFTQKVGMANNSVDFDDESQAVLFELDSYYESGQFYSESYYLPVNIKAPEFGEDETLLNYEGVQSEFNRFETAVYSNANYERFVNMDMLVRYMLVNDLVLNTELGHPKSAFFSRENMNHMTSQYTFGPAWDYDWSYNYEGGRSYCVSGATRDLFSYFNEPGSYFFSDLLRSSDWVQYHYHNLWSEFVDKHLDELIDFVDDYYAYAQSSFEHNAEMWGDGYDYDDNVANMKAWLRERAHYIKESLTPYETEPFSYGDLNGDGAISNIDMEYMLASLLDATKSDLNSEQADADANGQISISDLPWINLLLSQKLEAQARGRFRAHTLWNEDDREEEPRYDYDIDDLVTLTKSEEDKASSMKRTAAEENEQHIQTLTSEDGLLDYLEYNPNLTGSYDHDQYQFHYTSPIIAYNEPIERLRLKVKETSNNGTDYSGYPCFALAEFYLYDAYGDPVALSETNFATNAQEHSEGPMSGIVDGDLTTYFHSTWQGAIDDWHYLDIILPEPMSELSFGYISRHYRIAPATIELYAVFGANESEEPSYSNDEIGLAVGTSQGKWNVNVSLTNATPYIAYSMDFVLPNAFTAPDGEKAITLSYRTEDSFVMTGRRIDENIYRVIGYSKSNTAAIGTEDMLFTLSLEGSQTLAPDTYDLSVENIRCVTENAFEVFLPNAQVSFEVTDKDATHSTCLAASQGTCWPADVYDIHGRLVRKQAASLDGLSKGVYIINGQKVVW